MTDSFTPPPAEEKGPPRLGTFLTANRTRLIVTAGALALLAGAPAAFGAVVAPQPASSTTSIVAEAPSPSAEAMTAEETPEASPVPSADPAPAPAPAEAPAEAPVEAPAETPAPPAEAPAPAPVGNEYTVAPGDTVGSIAARFGVNFTEMLAANGLNTSSLIFPGQVLKLSGPPVTVMVTVPAAPAAAPAPSAPRAAAPAPAAPAAAPAPAPVPAAPAVRTIYVTGSGGQAAIDRCAGPVHFTPITESVSITEHDFCGGWGRFSGIQVGETVSLPGYGTFTAYARGNVPQGGTMNNVRAVLGGTPPVFLQTCIPGTSQMLVIGLR